MASLFELDRESMLGQMDALEKQLRQGVDQHADVIRKVLAKASSVYGSMYEWPKIPVEKADGTAAETIDGFMTFTDAPSDMFAWPARVLFLDGRNGSLLESSSKDKETITYDWISPATSHTVVEFGSRLLGKMRMAIRASGPAKKTFCNLKAHSKNTTI